MFKTSFLCYNTTKRDGDNVVTLHVHLMNKYNKFTVSSIILASQWKMEDSGVADNSFR